MEHVKQQELLLDHEAWALGIDVEDLAFPIVVYYLSGSQPGQEIDEQEALLREKPGLRLPTAHNKK